MTRPAPACRTLAATAVAVLDFTALIWVSV